MAAPIVSVEDLPSVAPDGSLLGLDLGTKTIGVAVCDPRRKLATPLETIARRKFTLDAERLEALARTWRATGFVLGLPFNMDGSEGPRAQATRAFARNLASRQALPIALWDERLSTFAAEERLSEAGVKRARRAALVDQYAAAHILQEAIQRLGAGAKS